MKMEIEVDCVIPSGWEIEKLAAPQDGEYYFNGNVIVPFKTPLKSRHSPNDYKPSPRIILRKKSPTYRPFKPEELKEAAKLIGKAVYWNDSPKEIMSINGVRITKNGELRFERNSFLYTPEEMLNWRTLDDKPIGIPE